MRNIKWREPAFTQRRPFFSWPFCGSAIFGSVICGVMVLCFNYVAKADGITTWFAFITPTVWMVYCRVIELLPARIIVCRKGIKRSRWTCLFYFKHTIWPWSQISRCCLEWVDFDNRPVDALIIYGTCDVVLGFVGVDRQTPWAELRSYLETRGMPLQEGGNEAQES